MTERIGPYRVYERLGVGGMGEVFKAYDDRLDRWVAIKRIRPDRLDAEDNRERFKREARATARLNHPAIVHLYGIFQDEEDADCIVMEFVDGRTLDTFLTAGPLEPLRVAGLGHEIASGLAEAHANGILHRDLKAENIMITPRGRAKILDFGLAKPILSSELDPVLTSKGQLVGTSRAMSPEYVSGEEVDHRSDLFSLGVLLYECLTGQSPFKAHNTLATLKQVMLHKQAPVEQISPDVPPELSELIDRLLSKDPSSRPQNAEEVALAFGRLTGQISSGVIDSPNLGSGGHPRTGSGGSTGSLTASDTMLDLRPRRRWMPVVGILALSLIGAFFLGRYLVDRPSKSESGPGLPPDRRVNIVLGEFDNTTGEDMLGLSIAELFRTALEQSRWNTVISQSQIGDALARMQRPPDTPITREVGLEVSQREGAERLILGSVSKFGQSYSIVVDVVEPANDRNTLSVSGTAKSQDELLSVIENLAQDVRSHLGESASEIEDTAVPLERVTTSSLEALKAYTAGQRHLVQGRNEEAIEFFRRAVSLDSGFAMAHAKLGVTYANLSSPKDAVESFKKALEHEEGLSEVQKLYLKGWLGRWQGNPEQVIANFGLISELYPSNYTASYNLGLALWTYENNFSDAVAALNQAAEAARGGERSIISAHLGLCLLGLDELSLAAEALEESQEASRLPGLVAIALIEGKRDHARSLLNQFPSPGEELLQAALIDVDLGDFDSARSKLERAEKYSLSKKEQHFLYHALADQAALAYFLGRPDEIAEIVKRAVIASSASVSQEGAALNSPTPLYLFLAKVMMRIGDESSANELISLVAEGREDGSLSVQVWEAFRISVEAERAILRRDYQLALDRAVSASRLASSVQLLEGLALVYESQKEFQRSREIYLAISEKRGLAFVECSASCYGRLYSSSLHRIAVQRLHSENASSLENRDIREEWLESFDEE